VAPIVEFQVEQLHQFSGSQLASNQRCAQERRTESRLCRIECQLPVLEEGPNRARDMPYPRTLQPVDPGTAIFVMHERRRCEIGGLPEWSVTSLECRAAYAPFFLNGVSMGTTTRQKTAALTFSHPF
jgi:hypothetical protein